MSEQQMPSRHSQLKFRLKSRIPEELFNAMPLNGWTLHDGYCEGVSHIGQYFEPGAIQMRLFVLEQEYANETTARQDMATEGLLDYTHVSGELFSGV